MLWNELIGWTDLALFLAMYAVSTAGITVGFHRLLTPRLPEIRTARTGTATASRAPSRASGTRT
jgi:fatty-acid desaturase